MGRFSRVVRHWSGRSLGLLAALLCGWQLAVAEDVSPQSDLRRVQLDRAFAELHAQADSPATAKAERDIWALWMHSGTAQEDKVLAEAAAAMASGNYGLSERLLNRLITDNPHYAEAWNKRATLFYLVQHFGESLDDIEKTLELEPRHFGALSGRGMIMVQLGNFKDALAAFEDAAAINPHMPGVNAAIAKLKERDGGL